MAGVRTSFVHLPVYHLDNDITNTLLVSASHITRKHIDVDAFSDLYKLYDFSV